MSCLSRFVITNGKLEHSHTGFNFQFWTKKQFRDCSSMAVAGNFNCITGRIRVTDFTIGSKQEK